MKVCFVGLMAMMLSGCVTSYMDAKGHPVRARSASKPEAFSQRLALAQQYMRHQRWDWALFHLRQIEQSAPDDPQVQAAIAQCLAAASNAGLTAPD